MSQRDIGAFATIDKKNAAIMIWNYHDDDDLAAPASEIRVEIDGVPAQSVRLTHYRIDQENSNSYEVWKKMGSPQNPSEKQVAALEKAGQLASLGKPQKLAISKGKANLNVLLPHQGVSLIVWNGGSVPYGYIRRSGRKKPLVSPLFSLLPAQRKHFFS